MKNPGHGSAVEWHQDWAFYPHTNDDLLEVGIALSDMTEENGALLVVPGSHKGKTWDHHQDGPLRRRHHRSGVSRGRRGAGDGEGRRRDAASRAHAARLQAESIGQAAPPVLHRLLRRRRVAAHSHRALRGVECADGARRADLDARACAICPCASACPAWTEAASTNSRRRCGARACARAKRGGTALFTSRRKRSTSWWRWWRKDRPITSPTEMY